MFFLRITEERSRPVTHITLCSAAMEWDSESVQSVDVFKQPVVPEEEIKMQPSTPQSHGGVRLHEFVSKTVRKTISVCEN